MQCYCRVLFCSASGVLVVLAFGVSFQACESVSYPLAADLLLRAGWGIVTKCNVYSVCVTCALRALRALQRVDFGLVIGM